jgi:ribosomal protein L18E
MGIIRGSKTSGLKILGNGVCTKKVVIEAQAFSASAAEKLGQAGISFSKIA